MRQMNLISMTSDKKAIPSVEEKRFNPLQSSNWLIFFFIFLLAGIVWFGFYATHTKEVVGSDDREYASIARNIVNGKGIVRNFIYPVDINYFDKVPVPEFMHPPGYPMILAGFFKVFGISDFVALLPSYLSYFILIPLFFYFTSKYLESQTAIFASILLIFNKEILNMSLIALSELVYTLTFFLFFILFIKANSIKDLFLSGIVLGVSHSIRENIYPLLIPALVYIYRYNDLHRWRKMIFFVTGLLIPLIPNFIRSFLETGSPFFSYGKFTLMAFTEKYPWLNVYRGIENLSILEFLTETPDQFIVKYLSNMIYTFEHVMSVSNPYLLAFFLVEMFYWKIAASWKRVKLLFLFILIFQIFFISLFTFTDRYFIPFIPLMILFASQGFLRISKTIIYEVNIHWKNRTVYLLFLLSFLFFMMPTVYLILKQTGHSLSGFKTPQLGFIVSRVEAERLNNFLKQELKENQIVWTDFPEILEWEGDRLCGWLPTHIQLLHEINKKFPVDAILLTNIRTPYKMEEEWRYLLFTEHSLPYFRTVKLYKSGPIFAKLLIRDEEE